MASRRDQLNAYTFARKRMVAAFLQPSAGGSEEGAPRPLRAVVPGLAVGALLLAGFGVWGMVKPGAPLGWNASRTNVLVGSESTTRYVVIKEPGKKTVPYLHPVLNLASAKLLLDSRNSFKIMKVDESVLDSRMRHGATLGIPYAPDRLPDPADAGTVKPWAVCEQPRGGGAPATAEPDKAVFVLGTGQAGKLKGPGRLAGSRDLYVQGPGGVRYLVDGDGTAFRIQDSTATGTGGRSDTELLQSALFSGEPQLVTADWLATLHRGTPLTFPSIPGFGRSAGMPGLGTAADRIGMVIVAQTGSRTQKYVVLDHHVAKVSDLVAHLLMASPRADGMYGNALPAPRPARQEDFTLSGPAFDGGGADWPTAVPQQANTGAHATSCSVYWGTMTGQTAHLGAWAGNGYPEGVANGGATGYVTPGSGLLYRQVTGNASSGPLFLVTDTGLRYSVPAPIQPADGSSQEQSSQQLLGYGDVKPVYVPEDWSAFLPTGPQLSREAAQEEQGS